VEGHKAHVHNGTVKNCGSNVQLNNYPDPSSPLPHVDGSHHVEYIISRGAGILGFSSGSDNNHFNNNTAWNDTEGFVDFGSYNLFDFNEVNQYLPPQDEPLLGFFALGGQHSQFNYNTVVYSPPVGTPADSYLLTVGFAVFSNNASFDHNTVTGWNFGFLVDGFKNLLTYNDVNVGETNAGEIGFYTTTADPNFWGFNTQTPTANTFQSNTVSGTTYGFRDEGDSDIFRYNTATDNGIGLFINGHATHAVVDGNTADVNAIGIQVRGSSTKVLANTTKNNLQTGIFVEVNGSNKIQSNTASGNLFLDLRDVVPNCGSNVWKLNTFGTANQACIH
jgi:parallel beta-helix repeat protein